MNSSAYIPVFSLPPTIITLIFTILLVLLLAPYNREISFFGIKFNLPSIETSNKKRFSIIIFLLLILSILLFLPVKPFRCQTKIAEFPDKNTGKITNTNVHTYPSTKSKTIGSVKDGETINVINIKYGWVRIKDKDIEGFLAANRTEVALDCPGLFIEESSEFSIR
jgi:uncharacterized protein YgiM (DUF1202 family)